MNFTLRLATIDALRDQAREEDRPMARIVDQAIREYIERQNEGK